MDGKSLGFFGVRFLRGGARRWWEEFFLLSEVWPIYRPVCTILACVCWWYFCWIESCDFRPTISMLDFDVRLHSFE